MSLHLFKLDDGETHHIVAETCEDALRIGLDTYDIPADPDDEPVTCEQVPDDQAVPVNFFVGRICVVA